MATCKLSQKIKRNTPAGGCRKRTSWKLKNSCNFEEFCNHVRLRRRTAWEQLLHTTLLLQHDNFKAECFDTLQGTLLDFWCQSLSVFHLHSAHALLRLYFALCMLPVLPVSRRLTFDVFSPTDFGFLALNHATYVSRRPNRVLWQVASLQEASCWLRDWDARGAG